jgi:hypothetical protein
MIASGIFYLLLKSDLHDEVLFGSRKIYPPKSIFIGFTYNCSAGGDYPK